MKVSLAYVPTKIDKASTIASVLLSILHMDQAGVAELRARVPVQRAIMDAEDAGADHVELEPDAVRTIHDRILTVVFPETRPAYLAAIESLEAALDLPDISGTPHDPD